MAKRILIVEDDQALARILTDNLSYEGFEVRWVGDGDAAISTARSFMPDLIVLDVMLPGQSGIELCGLLRQGGKSAIIMLSAKGQKSDKLQGLNVGADDYITKPFDLDELLARIHAVLRRTRPKITHLRLGPVQIDFGALRATAGKQTIHLTHREFEVLRHLAERHDKVVHRDELLREIWGYPEAPAPTRMVDHAIVRLRKKIEVNPHEPRFIHAVRGDGYCLKLDADADAS